MPESSWLLALLIFEFPKEEHERREKHQQEEVQELIFAEAWTFLIHRVVTNASYTSAASSAAEAIYVRLSLSPAQPKQRKSMWRPYHYSKGRSLCLDPALMV